ncbi:MAG: dihydroneopterin aldolase [Chitinophagaceae bacterium]|nr:MAG: dihydroneopterin aldolase [Chitinophagaceae bacterium]
MKVFLKDILLYGYHGVHDLERKVGTEFSINIYMDIDLTESTITLDDTIDYSVVFSLLKEEFSIATPLLENLAIRISDRIKSVYPLMNKIQLNIIKHNAPIEGFQGEVGIEFEKIYSL